MITKWKGSGAMNKQYSHRAGFTLIEIMIVVAIIGVLATMAIPSLMKARKDSQRQACIINLKNIDGAKQLWATEAKKNDSDVPSEADLFGNGKAIRDRPGCPAGGTYNLGAVSEKPTCSVPDHTL